MDDIREVTCGPGRRRTVRFLAAGAGVTGAAGVAAVAGTVLAVPAAADEGRHLALGLSVGLLLVLVGVVLLHCAVARVRADAHGVRSRGLLRRRSVPWRDVADLCVYLQRGRHGDIRRVALVRRDGRRWLLPLPVGGGHRDAQDFDAELDALRALHRRYGDPEATGSGRAPVISPRTAGHGRTGALAVAALLLAGAGLSASQVPHSASAEAAWRSAAPCVAGTSEEERGECLSTLPAVIARTDPGGTKNGGRVYFADGRPAGEVEVGAEAAEAFRAGDRVELTLWRGQVREIAGERHVWREHRPGPGSLAVIAALCALAAGWPGALALQRLRGRRLPGDEVLPSALPFAGALAGTALWLLPLCYLHPTTLLTSPVALAWGGAGSVVTLVLLAWAWRASRVRQPGEAEGPGAPEDSGGKGGPVFVAARFLEHTDYNPYGFGTHIVLGDGPPAVTPHSGPDRFAARRIPVERLTVRRVRGEDGDAVSGGWHVAELDDAGTPVRLAAAPADLVRVLRALGSAQPLADTGRPGR